MILFVLLCSHCVHMELFFSRISHFLFHRIKTYRKVSCMFEMTWVSKWWHYFNFCMNYPFKLPFFAHPPNKTTLDKAYFNVILQLFQLSSCVLQLLQKKWEMRHLSVTTLLSVLFLSRGRRNKKLFELVSLWHPTPGALEVDALLKLCLSSLQGHSFGLLPQTPDRSGNIHRTFLASFCFIWELLGDTLRCVFNQWS